MSIGPIKERVKRQLLEARERKEGTASGDQIMALAEQVEWFVRRAQQSHA
ncbi:hypothetical protein QEG98_36320 [Myxococcus sp. MxC21-1]|nr:hypothetical protein [Myxococcus sp. MxC21-1]WNZ61299.1 hypothetical protein QEG98_36320 [Myxococcus sp. MxC21-1]